MITPRQMAPGLLLCLMAGCVSQSASTGPRPAPHGPNAYIRATYYGGILNRQTEAVFKLDETAYVTVVHLGGDGRFDVIYPEDGRESGRVPGGKWFRTPAFTAFYDAAPQLYFFSTPRFRTAGAQLDSYDGRGYGFVFLIASKRPLHFERISELGLWNDLVADDYLRDTDPREAIHDFAEIVAGDQPYTLKFARSAGSVSMNTYADNLFDCAALSSFSSAALYAAFGVAPRFYSPFGYLDGLGYRGLGACSRYDTRFAYYDPFFYSPRPRFASNTPTPTPHENPVRPPRRRFGDPRSGLSFTNPTTRRNSPEQPAAAPRDRTIYAQPFGGTRHRESPRSAGSATRSARPASTRSVPADRHQPTVERAARTERAQPRESSSESKRPITDKP